MDCKDCKAKVMELPVSVRALYKDRDFGMREVNKIQTSNCPDGCCPTYSRLYQCDRCKRIDFQE